MIIDLPKHSSKELMFINEHMKIENDILMLKFPYSLRNAMYTLTYMMKGKHKCFYCSKETSERKMTLDHVFPQDLGGPTITNNLEPSCIRCNSQKSNMTKQQYEQFLCLPTSERTKYLKDIQMHFEFVRKWVGFELPSDWISEKEISNIITNISLSEDYKGNKYLKIKEYYKKYKHFQKPLILDRKNFLLDGFTTLMYAKNHNIKKVPVIILENVEVIF